MIIDLIPPFIDLPSVKLFISRIVEKLMDSSSCIVLLPETIQAHLISRLIQEKISRRNGWQELLDVNIADEKTQSPVKLLEKKIGIKWTKSTVARTIERMSTCAIFPEVCPDVLFIENLEKLSSPNINLWLALIQQWSNLMKTLKDRGQLAPSICIVLSVSSKLELPEDALFCKTIYWWGIPTTQEIKFLCCHENNTDIEPSHRMWREHLLPWLCAGDFSLFARMWNSNRIDEEYLILILLEEAADRGWNKGLLQTLKIDKINCHMAHNFSHYTEKPSEELMTAWAKGILGYCQDFGIIVSSAALTHLGREEEIHRRLWLAQCEMLLPILDRCRLSICCHLNGLYGENWSTSYLQPTDINEADYLSKSSLNCQYGHIESVINNWPKLATIKKPLGPFIYKFRKIRNDLAHNRPITFFQFKKLISDVLIFEKKINSSHFV